MQNVSNSPSSPSPSPPRARNSCAFHNSCLGHQLIHLHGRRSPPPPTPHPTPPSSHVRVTGRKVLESKPTRKRFFSPVTDGRSTTPPKSPPRVSVSRAPSPVAGWRGGRGGGGWGGGVGEVGVGEEGGGWSHHAEGAPQRKVGRQLINPGGYLWRACALPKLM